MKIHTIYADIVFCGIRETIASSSQLNTAMVNSNQSRVIWDEKWLRLGITHLFIYLCSSAKEKKLSTYEYVLLLENSTHLYCVWTECFHFKSAGFYSTTTGESLLHFCIHEIRPVWKYKQWVSFHSHCLQLVNSTVTRDSRIALTLAVQTSLQNCVHVCGCVCFRYCKNAMHYAFGR